MAASGARASDRRRGRHVEPYCRSSAFLPIDPDHAADRSDRLAREVGRKEIHLQFDDFADAALTSQFDEHATGADIDRPAWRPVGCVERPNANRPMDTIAKGAGDRVRHAPR